MKKHANTLIGTGQAGHKTRGQVMADTLTERLTGQDTAAAVPVEVVETDRRGVLRLAIPVTPVEAMLASLNWKFAAIGLAVVGLAALLSYTSARRISRPLEEMRLGAERLARGETMQLAPAGGEGLSTEMAALAAALNRMGAEIDRRIRLMIQQRNELEAMFASMADPVVAIDAERRVIRLNQAAATLFNLPAEGVQGKAVEGVLRHAELLDLIDRTLADNSRQDRRVSLPTGTEPDAAFEAQLMSAFVPSGNLTVGLNPGYLIGGVLLIAQRLAALVADAAPDAEGLLAVCVQHEIDHLNGILFSERAERMLTPEELSDD